MKFIISLILLVTLNQTAFAWKPITPTIQAIYGEKVTDNSKYNYKNIAEIVYDKKTETFGITFIDDTGKRETLDYAFFYMHNCKDKTAGAIAGPMIIDVPSKDRLNNILLKCNKPMFLQVNMPGEESATYRFNTIGILEN